MESEAEQYLGMSMTYSLFEIIKEKFDDVIAEQPDTLESYTEKSLVLENDEPAAVSHNHTLQCTYVDSILILGGEGEISQKRAANKGPKTPSME